jgi:secreted PhoX family phosphatase
MVTRMRRRDFLRLTTIGMASGAVLGSSIWRHALASTPGQTGPSPYGPLLAADANGFQLPAGFASRELARGGQVVPGTSYTWPWFPDGGATFKVPGGWVFAENSEWLPPNGGGVSALRFNRDGNVIDAYNICSGTIVNCAGGKTPWNTWLTCEEVASGHVWECDPLGETPAVRRDAMGTFKHEAVAADPRRKHFYLTEDEPNGRFYRFTPFKWRQLAIGGTLEVAQVAPSGAVTWLPVPNPNPVLPADTATRLQVPASTAFNGGEGIVYSQRHIYFTTKGDNRVWDYDTSTQVLTIRYERALDPGMTLGGVDNVTASKGGDLLVAEDGDNLELVLITPGGVVSPFLRLTGQPGSELCGPAFDPSGRRLYISSQRGGGNGITYEITGPFRRRAKG